jgi:phosphoglycolate phosphatase-like HAD superfamily hydrolase
VQAAQAASVRTLGYANKPGTDERLRLAGADVVVSSMTSLAELTGRTPAP